tara:strand:- start:193 stop:483 length:291 start_codon:yes stop_codon:yes gene_type:complete
MQTFFKFTVVYWCVEALQRVAFEGKAMVDRLGMYGVMSLITLLFISVSLWRSNRGDLFLVGLAKKFSKKHRHLCVVINKMPVLLDLGDPVPTAITH